MFEFPHLKDTLKYYSRMIVERDLEDSELEEMVLFHQPFIDILKAEGFTEVQATNKIYQPLTNLSDVTLLNLDIFLERKPEFVFNDLPSLLIMSKLRKTEIDVGHFMWETFKYCPNSDKKGLFRWMELWKNDLEKDEQIKIIDHTIDNKDSFINALYLDKILSLNLNTSLIEKAINKIKLNYNFVPVFNNINEDHILSQFKISETLINPTILEGVSTIRRIDHNIGTCPDSLTYHKETLFKENSTHRLGKNVFVYVKNQLVGSIKMEGDYSLIGLRPIFDGTYFQIIPGAIYGTRLSLVDFIEDKYMRANRRPYHINLNNLDVMPLVSANRINMTNLNYEDGIKYHNDFANRLLEVKPQ